MYKYFSGAGKVFLNTSQASPAPEKYFLSNASPAPEKPGKYLKTNFQRRRSSYTHISGAELEAGEAGEVFIYTGNEDQASLHIC